MYMYVRVSVCVCILVRYPVLLMVQCKRCGLEKQHLFSLSGFETVSPHIQRIPAVCVCVSMSTEVLPLP